MVSRYVKRFKGLFIHPFILYPILLVSTAITGIGGAVIRTSAFHLVYWTQDIHVKRASQISAENRQEMLNTRPYSSIRCIKVRMVYAVCLQHYSLCFVTQLFTIIWNICIIWRVIHCMYFWHAGNLNCIACGTGKKGIFVWDVTQSRVVSRYLEVNS